MTNNDDLAITIAGLFLRNGQAKNDFYILLYSAF